MYAQMKWQQLFTVVCGLLILAALALLSGCGGAVEEGAQSALEPAAADVVAPTATAEIVPTVAPATPAETVEAFFAWYLGYMGQGEMRRNPLVDGAYRQSEFLSPAFVEQVDEALAGMEGGGFDPILMAQDVPVAIEVVESAEDGDRATVTVERTFAGNPDTYPLQVELQRQDSLWLITDISDPQAGKAGSALEAAEGFYSWYLAYIGDPATDTFRNPLVDRAYRQAPYVSEAFVAEVDALLDQDIAEFGGIMADPILQAQDIPQGFTVEPGPAEEIVTVNLFFGETVYPVQVRVVDQDGAWLVDGIIPPGSTLPVENSSADAAQPALDTAGWQTVADEKYGFSFLLPPDWVAQPMQVEGDGIPEDWPVEAGYALMPQAQAQALAEQSGPPDPSAPPQTLFIMEMVIGDQQAYDRVYPAALSTETASYNGYKVQVERDHEEYTVVRYRFSHPENDDMCVVFSDALSEFPGREAQAAETAGILPAILESFSFVR